MASMNLDPSSALAEKYKGNRQVLEAAVLGRGADASIDPYSALRALQKLNIADKYEQMQKAMAGQPNQPSVAQQTLAKAAQTREPGDAPMPPIGPQGLQAPAPQGLGAMPVPEDTFNMAGGGIVAFAAGDEVRSGMGATNETYRYQMGVDPADRDAAFAAYTKLSDPDAYYGAAREQLETLREMGPGDLEQAKGLAALQAAAALSQGSDFVRGLGAAGAAFGESYGKAVDAANKEKRALSRMELELKNQERQEKLGNYKDAEASAQRALEHKNKAAEFNELKRQFEVNAGLKREEIDAAKAAAAAKGRDPTWQMELIRAEQAYAANPSKENLVRVQGARSAVAQFSDYATQETAAKMSAEITKRHTALITSVPFLRLKPEEQAAQVQAIVDQVRAEYAKPGASPEPSSGAGAPPPPPVPSGLVENYFK